MVFRLSSYPAVLFTVTLAAACGARDVFSTSPDHPANAAPAPASVPPPDPPPPAADEKHQGHEGHDHSTMDHENNEHMGHAMSGLGDPDLAVIAANEADAFAKAKPVFDRACAPCHTTKGAKSSAKALEHLSLDTYPFGGHHAATAGITIRKALGVDGAKATMPKSKPGSIVGGDLAAIVAWSKAFSESHSVGLHDHGGDGGHGDHR